MQILSFLIVIIVHESPFVENCRARVSVQIRGERGGGSPCFNGLRIGISYEYEYSILNIFI